MLSLMDQYSGGENIVLILISYLLFPKFSRGVSSTGRCRNIGITQHFKKIPAYFVLYFPFFPFSFSLKASLAQDKMDVVMIYEYPHSKDWKENPCVTNLQIILNPSIWVFCCQYFCGHVFIIVSSFVNSFPTINPILNDMQGITFWRVNHYNKLQDTKLQGVSNNELLSGEKS